MVYTALIYFAYGRSWKGIVVTILAPATSMFWFPAPKTADPMVEQFLQAEQNFLAGGWDASKILLTLTVPLFFLLLGLAFWKRSWWAGLAIINLAAIGKVLWSVLEAGESGWAVLLPALLGLIICDGVVILVWWLVKRRGTKTTVTA